MHDTDDLRPLEEIRAAVTRIERALLGDLSTGSPGLIERTRKAEDRLDRHSKRIHALEEQRADTARWTIRTLAEQAIGAVITAAMGAAGAIAAILGLRHH